MKKILLLSILFAFGAIAQPFIYVRASGPASVRAIGSTTLSGVDAIVCGDNLGNPIACGLSATDYVEIGGVCNTTVPSPLNGPRQVVAVGTTTVANDTISLKDANTGTNITGSGTFVSCVIPGGTDPWKFVGKLTKISLGPGPLGWFGGPADPTLRAVALSTTSGVTSYTRSGCPSACVITLHTNFDPTLEKMPVADSQVLSVWNTAEPLFNSTITSTNNWQVDGTTINNIGGGFGFATKPKSIPSTGNSSLVNLNCGPTSVPNNLRGGTDDCSVFSFYAYTGSAIWDYTVSNNSAIWQNGSGIGWKLMWEGGIINPYHQGVVFAAWATGIVEFLVDRTNDNILAGLIYALKHINAIDGSNFYTSGNTSIYFNNGISGGAGDTNYMQVDYYEMAYIYAIAGPYMLQADKVVVWNMIYNSTDDPAVSASNTFNNYLYSGTNHREVLTTAVAQGGTSTTITLNASDSAGTNFYQNNIVEYFQNSGLSINSRRCYGLVAMYDSTTKIATLDAGWTEIGSINADPGIGSNDCPTHPPNSSTTYTIYATAVITGSTGAGTTAAIVGYNTHFTNTAFLVPGTAITTFNYFAWVEFQGYASYVPTVGSPVCGGGCPAVSSDTSIPILVSAGLPAGGSRPAVVWYSRPWVAGDSGAIWAEKHGCSVWGSIGGTLFPTDGGGCTDNDNNTGPYIGGNTSEGEGLGHITMDLAIVGDMEAVGDHRAQRDLANFEAAWYDFNYSWDSHYEAEGFGNHGPYYTMITTGNGGRYAANALQTSISIAAGASMDFPSLDLANPTGWQSQSVGKIFLTYPDIKFFNSPDAAHEPWMALFGAENATSVIQFQAGGLSTAFLTDQEIQDRPTGILAKHLRHWLENINMQFGCRNCWSFWGPGGLSQEAQTNQFLFNDPRTPSLDYRGTLTHNKLFNKSSSTSCAANTGQPCSSTLNAASVVSRGGDGWTSFTNSHWLIGMRTFMTPDHDAVQPFISNIYKVGHLIAGDGNPPSYYSSGGQNPTSDTIGDAVQFGGATHFRGAGFTIAGAASSPPIRWGFSGGIANEDGDPANSAMVVCADLSTAYTLAFNYFVKCGTHSKPAAGMGRDEFIVTHTMVAPTVAISTVERIQFTQNGEPLVSAYPEGHTTVPGGEANLNSLRVVQSVEDGGQAINVVVSANYVGGLTLAGTGVCTLQVLGSIYGSGADALVDATISSGTVTSMALTNSNSGGIGYATSPTTASVVSCTGSATASGTASITVSGGPNADPVRNYGLMTRIFTPITGKADWGCPLGGGPGGSNECQPSPLSTYPGGAGHTDAVFMCGGASNCMTSPDNVTSAEFIVVHKIMTTTSDTMLITAAITPDVNWSGFSACGSLSCLVYLGARAGGHYNAITSFTPSFSGMAQWIINGVTGGTTYTVTVDGVQVFSGLVAVGDECITFDSVAGSFVLTVGGGIVVTPVVGHTSFHFNGPGSGTSPTIVTLGATLLIAGVTSPLQSAATCNVSDLLGNSWHSLANNPGDGNEQTSLWYAWNKSPGALATGTDTLTVNCASSSGVVSVTFVAYMGTRSESSPLDQSSGGGSGWTSNPSPGSITPSAARELIVSVVGGWQANTCTVDSSFTVTDCQSNSSFVGGQGWLTQISPSAVNPAWTILTGFGSPIGISAQASFFPASIGTLTGGTMQSSGAVIKH